jgi:AcrR family transcriptional regulator
VKAASLAAAYELLTEAGLSGVSFDEVSRRSGVAKTTIYRYWPTRSARKHSGQCPSVND